MNKTLKFGLMFFASLICVVLFYWLSIKVNHLFKIGTYASMGALLMIFAIGWVSHE